MTEPEFVYTDPSHTAINEETGEVDKIALHSNLNDGKKIVQNTARLLGRTDLLKGPTQEISVEAPLVFEDEALSINLTAVQDQLDALDGRIDALEADVATLETDVMALETNSATTTALNTEITDRTNADTALDARLDTIEARIPTPLVNYADDAAAAAGGIAVGRFYRTASAVKVRVS